MTDFATARRMMGGIKGLMTKLGDAPAHDHKWKTLPKCPFCGNRGSAGVYEKNGVEAFKCHNTGCSSGPTALSDVDYLAVRRGLSRDKPVGGGASPAYEEYLKMAGCWEPPRNAERGTRSAEQSNGERGAGNAEHSNAERGTRSAENGDEPTNAELVEKATRIVVSAQAASVRLLTERMGIGKNTAGRLLEDLEKAGVIGPAQKNAPRLVLLQGSVEEISPEDQAAAASSDVPDVGGVGSGSDDPVATGEPTVMPPPDAAPTSTPDGLHNDAPAASQSSQADSAPAQAVPEPEADGSKPKAKQAKKAKKAADPLEDDDDQDDEEETPRAPVEKTPPGLVMLRDFYSRLQFTQVQMELRSPSGEKISGVVPKAALKTATLHPVPLFEKRGLTTKTCLAMGLRANPRSNEELLIELMEKHGWDEALASGLWLDGDRRRDLPRRVNQQFCGHGMVGRKPDEDRRRTSSGKLDPEDKAQWGYCEPVLIPYYSATGELMKLRPHKGGAAAWTAAGAEQLYVPRNFGEGAPKEMPVEKFHTVIICEGEYKAMAIWQMIGCGGVVNGWPAEKEEVVGVCAMPGISFARNPQFRYELDEWLVEVGCRKAIVAFDREDNRTKPMRQRHDAQIYARYLAKDITRKANIPGFVLNLPDEWMTHGKADWDGALVKLLRPGG